MVTIREGNRKWWILTAATITLSMIFLGQTIINVTLPLIQREFEATEIAVQWIINSFILFLAAFVLLGGKLSDHFGTKKMFMTGLIIISFGSVMSGIAPTIHFLIAGRSIQGFGGSLLLPSLMAISMRTFKFEERGKSMGILIGVSGIFLSLGPLLGGFLTEYLNWRWVFWLNLPFAGAAAIIAAFSFLPQKKNLESIGLLKLLFLSLSILAFIFALMQLSRWGLSWPIGVLLIVSALSLLVSIKLDRHSENPLFDPFFLKDSKFLVYNLVISCSQLALISTIFITLYLQNILHYSPLEAGLLMLPATLPQLIMGPLGGWLADRKGALIPCFIGLLLIIAGEIWIVSFTFYNGYFYLLPGIIAVGCGAPFTLISCNYAALALSPAEKYGLASGLISTLRQLGSSVGLAFISTILIFRGKETLDLLRHASPRFDFLKNWDPSQILTKTPDSVSALNKLSTEDQALALQQSSLAFEKGFSGGMIFVAAICIIGLLVSGYYLKIKKLNS